MVEPGVAKAGPDAGAAADAAGAAAGNAASPTRGAAFSITQKHRIVAGAALVAVLAGAAVTAVDYPWNFGNARSSRRAAERREAPLPPLALKPSLAAAPAGADASGRKETTEKAREVPAANPVKQAAKTHSPNRSASPPNAQPSTAPPRTRPVKSLDARYKALVEARCAKGLRGLTCREEVRWQLCRGRWNRGGAGASSCRVNSTETLWSSAG